MDVLYRCCCGMDVHKDTVAACVLIWEAGRARKEKRVFGTTTKQLLELSDWLHGYSVMHVAMESTGGARATFRLDVTGTSSVATSRTQL